ncbi:hypothetical protein ABPG75_009132 [Micractinium tetrahymenae]
MPPSAAEGSLLSSLRPLASRAAQQVAGKASCAAPAAMSGAALGAGASASAAAGLPQLIFTSSAAHGHMLPGHVEQPARVDMVMERLGAITGSSAFQAQLHQLATPPPAPLEAVKAVHSYVDELRRTAERAGQEGQPAAVADIGDPDGVTYVTGSSFDDALRAAGAACTLVDAVVAASCVQQAQQAQQAQQQQQKAGSASAPAPPTPGLPSSLGAASSPSSAAAASASTPLGAGTAAFSICRPPGHHATADTPLGYCLFNNVALSARHAQRVHGLAKVLILDFDLHHGNGTADIFASDPSVLFIDTHEASSVYPPPFAPAGAEDVGEGLGRGATINVPLPRYAGDASMMHVFDGVVAPAAERFRPDIILVSAGFDAHWRDPFQQLQLRSSTYHRLACRLRELAGRLCGGRLLFLLEGGYHTEAVAESVGEVFLALLGQPSEEGQREAALPHPEPLQEVEALVARLRSIHGLQ